MKNITTVLRELRSHRNRTQDYMASKLGVSQSQYNKIEKGEKPLELDMLTNIAKIFDMQPKQLFSAIYEEDKTAPLRKVFIGAEAEATIKHEEEDNNYYKKMAIYFEKRFLKTYRMYIELSAKQGIQKPSQEMQSQPLTIAI